MTSFWRKLERELKRETKTKRDGSLKGKVRVQAGWKPKLSLGIDTKAIDEAVLHSYLIGENGSKEAQSR